MEIGLGLGWIALKRKGISNPHFFQLLLSLTHLTDLNEFVTKRNTRDSKNMPVHGTVCFSLYCNTVHLVTKKKTIVRIIRFKIQLNKLPQKSLLKYGRKPNSAGPFLQCSSQAEINQGKRGQYDYLIFLLCIRFL